ncbi:MAG: TadE/TadG family type IV pilus assembly protein [Parvibaculaceae bacterium]
MPRVLHRIRRRAAASIRRFRRDARGVVSIEMALIFPIMLILYFGMVDVSNLLSANRRVTLTASTLADLVTQAPGTLTKADINGFFNAAGAIMQPFPANSISLEVFDFTKDGNNVKLAWQHKNATANCGAAPTADDQMKALMAEGNDVVVARVCFSWNPIVGYVIGTNAITLSDKLTLRPRQSSTLACSNC